MNQPLLTHNCSPSCRALPCSSCRASSAPTKAQTGNAVAAALPLLLGALGRNTAQPQGAEALFGALERDHGGGMDIGNVLGAVLGGTSSRQTDGAGILGHILGASQPRAAQAQAGDRTGQW